MYAEALSEVVLARIYLHNRQILERDTSTLKDIGITTNTRLIVEELIEVNIEPFFIFLNHNFNPPVK